MKKFLVFLILAAAVLAIWAVGNIIDHNTFETVKKDSGIIVVNENDPPIFVPKGAFLIGVAEEVKDIDGLGITEIGIVPQGELKKEFLLRPESQIIIYFDPLDGNKAQELYSN